VFDKVSIERTPVQFRALSLRPASRDLSGDARSGNINQHAVRDLFISTLQSLAGPSSRNAITNTRLSPAVAKGQQHHVSLSKLPTYPPVLRRFRSARSFPTLTDRSSDVPTGDLHHQPSHLEASRHIFSSQCIQNRPEAKASCKLDIFLYVLRIFQQFNTI
jgi:hypothetical protein